MDPKTVPKMDPKTVPKNDPKTVPKIDPKTVPQIDPKTFLQKWIQELRDVFHLSRSEAKVAAKAVHEAFIQRDAESPADLAQAVKTLTQTLKTF